MIMRHQIVLASGSVYRKTLLERLGLPFMTVNPTVDETPYVQEPGIDLVRRLARLKADHVALQYPDALVIGSDQCAVLDDAILGKPGDFAAALHQLKQASGRVMYLYTGLCVLDTHPQRVVLDVVTAKIHFRQLDERQISAYLKRERPFDCAGSFKSEGLGIALFSRLECDDPTAVIGLPLIRLTQMLAHQGVDVLDPAGA